MVYAKVTDFLSIDPTTIILVLANTLILFLVLKHFLFNKVNQVIDDRKAEVENTFKRADEAEEKAKQLEMEYNEKIMSAKDESAEIVRNATKKAQSRSDEIISDAKAEAKAIVANATAEIEREKKIAVNQIKDEIAGIAFSVAEAVIEKELDVNDNEKLIESFIDSVGEM